MGEVTADAKQVLDLATVAEDRDKLLDLIADAQSAKSEAKPTKFWVVRQYFAAGEVLEVPLCRHRFEWTADLCAYRRTRRHNHEAGGHYIARRAEA